MNSGIWVLDWLYIAATAVFSSYCLIRCASDVCRNPHTGRPSPKGQMFREMCLELRMPMLWSVPWVMVGHIRWEGMNPIFKVFFLLIDMYWAYIAYKDKDDRWKKRRKKLLEKVSVQAGKLVVVPVTGGSK